MDERPPRFYEFGAFRLDAAKRLLWRGGETVPLVPKAFDVLLALVSRHGQVVSKDELMASVWRGAVVEENSLNVNVSSLRKAFGEKPYEHRFIVTVPGVGYKFVAEVEEVHDGPSGRAASNGGNGAGAFTSLAEAETEAAPRSEEVSGGEAAGSRLRRREARGRWGWRAAIAVALAALSVAWFVATRWQERPAAGANPPVPFQTSKALRLTTSGNATGAAISPDGKYAVYELDEGGRKSLWLRQVDVASSVRITAPQDSDHWGLTFSRDGNYIYYFRNVGGRCALFQTTALGQATRRLVEDVDSSISLSPDSRRIAFFRYRQPPGQPRRHELVLANADGTGEQVLAARHEPYSFGWFNQSGPAWSPDGKSIACIAVSIADKRTRSSVIAVNVADGREQTFTSREWEYINQIAWLPDGDGLLFTGRDHASPLFQIWHLSYPGGEARRVTSDLSDYYTLSLSADGRSLAAVQFTQQQNLWVEPAGLPGRGTRVTAGAGTYPYASWSPDGRVVYDSYASGSADIWIANADGSDQRQLTNNSYQNYGSAVSPDGRYVLFHSNRTGTWQIWRVNIDGSRPVQLTEGDKEANLPNVSPDGKWVAYQSGGNIWKVPIDGGPPVRLTDQFSQQAAFSPDGEHLACWYREGQAGAPWRIAVVPADGGPPVKLLPVPEDLRVWKQFFMPRLRWSPDGRALAYLGARGGITQVWLQPLEGGPPKQLTDSGSEHVFSFDWSRDDRLLLSRGSENYSVILLRDVQ